MGGGHKVYVEKFMCFFRPLATPGFAGNPDWGGFGRLGSQEVQSLQRCTTRPFLWLSYRENAAPQVKGPRSTITMVQEKAGKIAKQIDKTQGRKKYTPPPWRPSFFSFPGLRLYGVYPSFQAYGIYPFPLFSQENSIHHSFFCSVTSGSGDRPRKEGPTVVVYTLFSPEKWP